jgi:hypothetical protein
MRKRASGPVLTGADYLINAAQTAVGQGHPYSDVFRDMLYDSIGLADPAALSIETEARRPLMPHKVAPVAILGIAADAAMRRGDIQAVREVLMLGGALVVKWSEYLVLRDQHPTLCLKPYPAEEI